MKNKLVLLFVFLISFVFSASSQADDTSNIISNKFFSIKMPDNTTGLYDIKKRKNSIFIYDKASKKEGFGGLAFGIQAFKNPSDYSMTPGVKKFGELSDKKGKLYDIVLLQPTDVQYDYIKGEPDSYKLLFDLAQTIKIEGVKKNKYFHNQGTKGEYLYKEILKKHITAIKEKWNSEKLEQEDMSYMYNTLAKSYKNVLQKIGYTYYDINSDGIDELFVGEISQGNDKGIIYDVYTMVNREPVHVISGGNRNKYFVCNKYFLCNEYSLGAKSNGFSINFLVPNSTELFLQADFKYDANKNPKQPYFIFDELSENQWQNIPKTTFIERKNEYSNYKKFNYTPLTKNK